MFITDIHKLAEVARFIPSKHKVHCLSPFCFVWDKIPGNDEFDEMIRRTKLPINDTKKLFVFTLTEIGDTKKVFKGFCDDNFVKGYFFAEKDIFIESSGIEIPKTQQEYSKSVLRRIERMNLADTPNQSLKETLEWTQEKRDVNKVFTIDETMQKRDLTEGELKLARVEDDNTIEKNNFGLDCIHHWKVDSDTHPFVKAFDEFKRKSGFDIFQLCESEELQKKFKQQQEHIKD